MYKFTNPESGEIEEVKRERWAWGVTYEDGSIFVQFDDEGFFHRIGEVDMDRVKIFTMFKPENPTIRHDMVVTEDMKPFHKYRNIKLHYLPEFVKIYIFGYSKGKSGIHYNFILPDDRVIQSDTDNVELEKFEIHRGL